MAYKNIPENPSFLKDMHGNMRMMVPTRIRFARDKESDYVKFRTETDDTHN